MIECAGTMNKYLQNGWMNLNKQKDLVSTFYSFLIPSSIQCYLIQIISIFKILSPHSSDSRMVSNIIKWRSHVPSITLLYDVIPRDSKEKHYIDLLTVKQISRWKHIYFLSRPPEAHIHTLWVTTSNEAHLGTQLLKILFQHRF